MYSDYVLCIMLLLFVLSEEMRRWFLNQETELLKHRFLNSSTEESKAFFQLYKDEFCFETVTVPLQINASNSEEKQVTFLLCVRMHYIFVLVAVITRVACFLSVKSTH